MYLVTRIIKRNDVNVSFTHTHPEFAGHFEENYRSTGKFLGGEETISEDGLTLTIVSRWADQAAFEEQRADPSLNKFDVDCCAYDREHGIVTYPPTFQTV